MLDLATTSRSTPATSAARSAGARLSGNPFSTIGFERRHNPALGHDDVDAFTAALLRDLPPPPEGQTAIDAANRAGSIAARA